MIEQRARLFTMHRECDETGVSGTGPVLDGVEWADGTVAVRWRTATASSGTYNSMADFDRIHIASHPTNRTRIEWH